MDKGRAFYTRPFAMVYELPLPSLLIGVLGIHRQAIEERLVDLTSCSLFYGLSLASCHPIDAVQLPVNEHARIDHLRLHKRADPCIEVLHRVRTVSDLGHRFPLSSSVFEFQLYHIAYPFWAFLPVYKGYEQAYAYSWLYYIINKFYFFKNMISLDISIIHQIFSRRIIENEH